MEPARFFDEILPALARDRAADFPALAQTAIIAVGTQAWTCTLHDDVRPVTRGVDRKLLAQSPDAPRKVTTRRSKKPMAKGIVFEMWLDEGAFQALLDGTLDERALAERRIGYRGDLRWLAQLGRMLAGSGDAVIVRGGN
jgi:hypothetical protein